MKLQFREGQEIIFLDKPAGLSTHAADAGRTGFVEWVSRRLGRKLWVVHRLDKGTTGALAFALSAEKAETLRQDFAHHRVRKTYWFLTDRTSREDHFEVRSHIEKVGSRFVSNSESESNSHTVFRRIKRSPFFELWEARPQTGRPHQIRLHAAQAGLPLLGDEIYGGTPFPHLCLHALALEIPGEAPWICPAPRFFERLGALKDPALVGVLSAIDRRQRLFHFLGDRSQTLRLVHNETRDLKFDRLGPVSWLSWYHDSPPTERDLERWDFVRTLLGTPLVIQKRQDRGADPNSQTQWLLGEVPETWTAREGDLNFEFRREQGLSAGLFLDQRRNRARLRELAPGREVLNLFAYTAGFSLAAAKAGAARVTTVDLSKKFLGWGQNNFRLNELRPEDFEWSAADTFTYLQIALKKDRKWDVIVCDPPSFSRSEKGVFRLDDDLEKLAELCGRCLKPGGVLLFSCNHEGLTGSQVSARLKKTFPRAQITAGEVDLDYELPDHETSLKSFWIQT